MWKVNDNLHIQIVTLQLVRNKEYYSCLIDSNVVILLNINVREHRKDNTK